MHKKASTMHTISNNYTHRYRLTYYMNHTPTSWDERRGWYEIWKATECQHLVKEVICINAFSSNSLREIIPEYSKSSYTTINFKSSVKCYGWRQNLCFTLTGSFSCIWHYRSPDSSFLSQNCFWHLLYCSPVVSIVPSSNPDRNQCVVVNNSASSSSPVMFGVPQGSMLGPVLFIFYTTPLSDIIASHSVNYQLFADNTQLQKSTPPNDM